MKKKRAKPDGGIVAHIVKALNALPGCWAWRANAGAIVTAGSFVWLGLAGSPDILGLVEHSRPYQVRRCIFFGIEAKRAATGKNGAGKRNANQIAWHARAAKLGVPVLTVEAGPGALSKVRAFVEGLR